MSQHPRTGNGTRANAKYVKSTSYISYGMTRREALKFAFGAVTAAVLYGIPRTASAASATKETTDALNNAQAKYNEVQSQLNAIASEYQALAEELNKTMGNIESVQNDIDATQAEIEKKRRAEAKAGHPFRSRERKLQERRQQHTHPFALLLFF